MLSTGNRVTNVYETTDKLFLPSGKYVSSEGLRWGKEDISDINTYQQKITNKGDIGRILPISYWTPGSTAFSWLRLPYYLSITRFLSVRRGYIVGSYYVSNNCPSVAPAFRVNLDSVIFSSVSAASLAAEGGDRKFEVSNTDIGRKVATATADYGMYLKKERIILILRLQEYRTIVH